MEEKKPTETKKQNKKTTCTFFNTSCWPIKKTGMFEATKKQTKKEKETESFPDASAPESLPRPPSDQSHHADTSFTRWRKQHDKPYGAGERLDGEAPDLTGPQRKGILHQIRKTPTCIKMLARDRSMAKKHGCCGRVDRRTLATVKVGGSFEKKRRFPPAAMDPSGTSFLAL